MSTPSWVPAIVAIDEHMGPYAAQILADQLLGDDDPARAATDAYQAIAALDPLVDLHQAQLRYDIADTTTVVAEVTCARDIPGEGICLRAPGHDGRCTRTSDRPALPHPAAANCACRTCRPAPGC